MRPRELDSLITKFIPDLYAYAYSLINDELQSEQLVIDAYSVFVLKERDYLQEYKYDNLNRYERFDFQKYCLNSLLAEIYQLGARRTAQLNQFLEIKNNYTHFYRLDLTIRSALFLKDRLQFKDLDIQEVMGIQKHHLLEKLYMGRKQLSDIIGTTA